MNIYLFAIIVFLVGFYILDAIVEIWNSYRITADIPEEFQDVYDQEKYTKAQKYLKETTIFGLIHGAVFLILTILFILIGGFNFLDLKIRALSYPNIFTGVIYILILGFISQLISIPFSYFSTFNIESKYGFNKSTKKIFIMDFIKSSILGTVIASVILFVVLGFFEYFPTNGWLIVWGALIVIQFILIYIAPTLIMPIFNKFTPLEDGDLKNEVENFANKHQFNIEGIYTMDGSKRSTKANAFFTGFGKQKRIVLFDTLIDTNTTKELLAVLAHEIGHYKMKHIHQGVIMSIFTTGLMLFLLSFFLDNKNIADAFKMDNVSIYTSIVFFGFLFRPLEEILSIFNNLISRKNEFAADTFSKETTNDPESLVSGLKKLSVESLSNLTPIKFKVIMDYSHPPVIERIKALREK
ncbi:MAG: M48 family metallopeptidase [Dehalococcoidia bacterium]